MNVQELISSGKLELYVAGTLSEREMGDVAASALEYPEIATEIEKIERAMLDFLSPVEFNMTEREKDSQLGYIFDRIHVHPPQTGPIRRINRLGIAAAVAGLILTTGLSVWLALRDNNLSREMAALRADEQSMSAEKAQYEDHVGKMQEQFTLMRNILTRRVELTAVAGSKITAQDNYMLLYWNPATKKLMLADAHLPALSPDQQYQLWALYNGQPVDAGVFDYKDNTVSVGFQKDVPGAQAFAVTVEPKGGSKTPTLSNLCMMAKL
ncbi:anti-sigma factor [Dinghuibacter silviterrae]|nr:anti-sigma factor [Dinghuibacter silviterrae]